MPDNEITPSPEGIPRPRSRDITKKNKRRGAPEKNKNAIRHGLTSGSLPDGCSYVVKLVSAFRSALEAATVATHGEITLPMAAAINTAARHEQTALLAQRWLRKDFDSMSPDQKLSYAKQIANSSTARDQAIKSLELDRDRTDSIEDSYAAMRQQLIIPPPPDSQPAAD